MCPNKVSNSIYDIAINIGAYNIANNYNLALYKTVFVDEKGNIKHNSADNNIYGNILDDFEKIEIGTFQNLSKIWNITRDDITPCNVCEFRYCCTTTYVPQRSAEGYTVDCNYDPYIAEFKK